MHVSDKCTMHL